MKNYLLALILGIFLLTIVSANPIRLNESKFQLNAYAGETIQKEITVYSNGDYGVIFKSDNENITVTPNETIISKEEVVMLNITFNSTIPSGTYNFNIIASTDYEEVIVPVNVESSGGGGNYRYKVTYTPLNESRNETIINPIENKTVEETTNETKEIEDVDEIKDKGLSSILGKAIIILSLILVISLIVIISRNIIKGKKEDMK